MTVLGSFVVGETLKASDMNIIGTWSSFTVVTTGSANMNFTGKKCVLNKICFFQIVGTATGACTPPTIVQLPQTMDSSNGAVGFQAAYLDDSATVWYYGPAQRRNSTEINTRAFNVSATYMTANGLTNLIPFAWGIGDLFVLNGQYEIA